MMNLLIETEAELFVYALLLGIFATLINEGLEFLRKMWHHGWVVVAIMDVCYWILVGTLIIALVYQKNEGRLRGFLFLGFGIGFGIVRSLKRIINHRGSRYGKTA